MRSRRVKTVAILFAIAAFALLYQQLRPHTTPSLAPAFTLPSLPAGQTIALQRYRGHAVVVNFFATWCRNCRAEKKFLRALQAAHAELPIISILTFDPDPNLTNLPQPPVALDADGAVARRYGVSWLPQTFLIDARGHIIQHFNQPLDISRYKLLAGRVAKLNKGS